MSQRSSTPCRRHSAYRSPPSSARSPMTETQPAWKAAAEAHKRAMPLQRLTGNGMDYADVIALYADVDAGTPWDEAAERLGDQNLERAERAARDGHLLTARSWFLAA